MSSVDTASRETLAEGRRLAVVDCDVHQYFVDGIQDLFPYVPESWRRRLGIGQSLAWGGNFANTRISLPKDELYINSGGGWRLDSTTDEMPPATDPAFVARHLLDENGIDRAILLGGHVLGLGAMPNSEMATVIASAYNDWMSERWLQADARYRGSILVAPQLPERAAEEIDRVADRPGIVQVLLPLAPPAMGEAHYYPIYEAAQRHGLPIAVHPSGTESIYPLGPRMAQVPTYYVEWHTALTQPHQSNVLSMLCHGVFERFPSLMLVVAEGGFAWAVDVIWRLDKNWKGLRDEVPWVKRLPSEYLFEHVRFTTQPFPDPDDSAHVRAVCEILHGDRTLIFSSDYPHWDFDDPYRALDALPPETRQRICVDNARELYGDRLH
jgi:predicted TIM-barrel fold metal-dependent hydrolase